MPIQRALRTILTLATLVLALPAPAQLFRAYLSVGGSDANPCTLPQPCRLLPAALAAVASGGEIWMLDSANYNTASVAVGKSVSILAVPGAVGSVLAIGGPAFQISAPGLDVALTNLVMAPLPAGGGTDGVNMTGASALTVSHCTIANMPGRGIYVLGTGTLKLAHSTIRNTGYAAVQMTSGGRGEISHSNLASPEGGVFAYGTSPSSSTLITVSDTIISGGGYGVWANSSALGTTVRIALTRSTVQGTNRSIYAYAIDGSAIVSMSSTLVHNNNYGWYQAGAGARVHSLGNNHIADNGLTFGALTPIALQ